MYQLDRNCPPERFYRGGDKIAQFRGLELSPEREPEDWVGSTVTLFGDADLGLSRLPDGRFVRDALLADPVFWFGSEHLEAFGADPMVLTKLLEAGERLPVHAHPHSGFAHEHFGSTHGKAEAWYVLSPGEVWLGIARELSSSVLAELVEQQRVDEMRGYLHRLNVSAGEIVYVPPGTLHAIGSGVFVVEVQEPTDLSILAEWKDFDIDGAQLGHLGVGFDLALQAVDLAVLDEAAVQNLVSTTGELSTEYFRIRRVDISGEIFLPASYAVVVVVDGAIRVESEYGEGACWESGTTWLVPHGDGQLTLTGSGSVVVCQPPVAAV